MILIADDDRRINELLQEIFTMEGYETLPAYDGEEVIHLLERGLPVELVILDVMMPKLDGWDVLDYIKKHFDVKVLILTALTDETNEVRGLREGADDYVKKPFRRAVLLERVRRLLREQHRQRQYGYRCGALFLSQSECRVYNGDTELKLTMKEYSLLLLLMQNSRLVLEREVILGRIWGANYERNDRVIDTHIKMLRQSLGDYGALIRTIRGVGYSFEGEVETICAEVSAQR